MRAADCEALPPEERPFWYKPRPRGHAGAHRLMTREINLTAWAVKRLKRAEKIRERLRRRDAARKRALLAEAGE